jgi:glutamine amidotransferase
MMIAMIDMGLGNLQSVSQALERVGGHVEVTTRVDDIGRADAVILPGVGAFGDGMASLHTHRLVEPIRDHVIRARKPLLGICLGMQLLAYFGEEYGRHEGLGLIAGVVRRLAPTTPGCRVPNMGWCDVTVTRPHSQLFNGIPNGEPFYFAHSYWLRCAEPADVAATIEYDGSLTAAIERENVFGVQFHPEKSQDAGLSVLHAFVAVVRERKAA